LFESRTTTTGAPERKLEQRRGNWGKKRGKQVSERRVITKYGRLEHGKGDGTERKVAPGSDLGQMGKERGEM